MRMFWQLAGSPPIGRLEEVKVTRHRLLASGWAADRDSVIRAVEILLDGTAVGTARLDFARPDIAEYYAKPAWSHCGWRFLQSWRLIHHAFERQERVLLAGRHRLSVVAISSRHASAEIGARVIVLPD